jgi:anti-sigma factor RsiW
MDDVHSFVAPYALDALDAQEESDFEQHLALCERCREELAALREAAGALAYAPDAPAPPAALRERILAQARAERPNVVPLRPRRRLAWPLATAAAACAAVVACCAADAQPELSIACPVAVMFCENVWPWNWKTGTRSSASW